MNELLTEKCESQLRILIEQCSSVVHAENALKVVYALCQNSTSFCETAVALGVIETAVMIITGQVSCSLEIDHLLLTGAVFFLKQNSTECQGYLSVSNICNGCLWCLMLYLFEND